MTSLIENRIAKARRILAFVDARGVADQAQTYTDPEWIEMASESGEVPVSEETIVLCRALLAERQPSTLPTIDRERAREGFTE